MTYKYHCTVQVGEGMPFFFFFKSSPVSERKLLPGCTMHKWKQLSLRKAANALAMLSEHKTRHRHCENTQPTARRHLLTWFSHDQVVFFWKVSPAASSLDWVSLLSAGDKALAAPPQLLHSPATAAREKPAAWVRYRPFPSSGVSLPMPYKA